MSSKVPRGLVENKARHGIAGALMHGGPLTARGLAKDTGLSIAASRYHLRVLASADAVRPCLKDAAKDHEVAWVLVPERLSEPAREDGAE